MKGAPETATATAADRAMAAIESTGVVAILRGPFLATADVLTAALIDGGIRAIEVPFGSSESVALYRKVKAVGGPGFATGFGTVTTLEQLRTAIGEGADFVVAPNTDPEIVALAVERGLLIMPGAFTPSEIVTAVKAGAQAVKLFPADVLGERFVRGVRGPLPDVRLVPTGGVTVELARSFRAGGAWAVGVGAPLVGRGGDSVQPQVVAALAREFVRTMRSQAEAG